MKEFEFEAPRQKNLVPEGDEARHVKLVQLQEALHHAWGPDTCADWQRYKWTPGNPAFGQCAVTALVVQDFIGGRIIKDCDHDHYWNILDDGTEVDLSREQFSESIKLQANQNKPRAYMLESARSIEARTPERYELLKERVIACLGF
jgi:hypothetical protein